MNIGRPVGAFGPYVFYVSADLVHTFQSGSRERGASFVQHRVIGQKDRLEPIAVELDQVTLDVVLDQELGVPPTATAVALNQLKELQQSWPLFIGPYPLGEFVITKISEDWKRFARLGAIARMKLSISFLEQADGPLTVRAKKNLRNALA
jgi:phage protein U